MEILPKQTSLFGETELMCLQADFLANHTALQENAKARKMSATYGRKCLELYEKFPRHTLWGKTLLGYLVGMTDWYSTKCKLTWKMKGTKYNRLYFQLVPSTLRTEGIDFGLLPTPLATDTIETAEPREITWTGNSPRIKSKQGTDGQAKLSDLALNNLLPTPRANKVNGLNLENNEKLANRNKSNLEEVIAKTLLPTPDCSDRRSANSKQQGLSNVVAGRASQLNPQFVRILASWRLLGFL